MAKQAREWFSYDSAAEVYDTISAPLMFEQPGSDLVNLLNLKREDRVLDVGAGTGAISKAAQSEGSSVTAIDLSSEMLSRTGLKHLVSARVPGLPFAPNTFDAVTAGFLLTHIPDYAAALTDMKRVLAPFGKIGLAFWKINQNTYSEVWLEIAEKFAGNNSFSDVVPDVLPWEDLFSDPGNVHEALSSAGFCSVAIIEKSYTCRTNMDDYLASKNMNLQARFLRHHWNDQTWLSFVSSVQRAFREQFTEPLEFSTQVIFGIGQKWDV
jgi:ubiquinone/menaquinone biosynthesis C-methylase UbiE